MQSRLNEEQLERLMSILESEGLQDFLPYAQQAAAEMEFSAARRLVWKTYRQIFISLVAIIVAVATFWDKMVGFLRAAIGDGG